MATFTSIQQYRMVMQKRIEALRRSGDKSAMSATSHQMLEARRMAPVDKGALRANIRRRKLSNGRWSAESWVPGGFKYNFWVNRSPGYERLIYKRANPRFGLNVGDILIYGASPNWRWTGVAQYWSLATQSTRNYFRRIAVQNARKALRVKA